MLVFRGSWVLLPLSSVSFRAFRGYFISLITKIGVIGGQNWRRLGQKWRRLGAVWRIFGTCWRRLGAHLEQ